MTDDKTYQEILIEKLSEIVDSLKDGETDSGMASESIKRFLGVSGSPEEPRRVTRPRDTPIIEQHREVGSLVFVQGNAYVCTCVEPHDGGFCETCGAHDKDAPFGRLLSNMWSEIGIVPGHVVGIRPKRSNDQHYFVRVLPLGMSNPVWCNDPHEVHGPSRGRDSLRQLEEEINNNPLRVLNRASEMGEEIRKTMRRGERLKPQGDRLIKLLKSTGINVDEDSIPDLKYPTEEALREEVVRRLRDSLFVDLSREDPEEEEE